MGLLPGMMVGMGATDEVAAREELELLSISGLTIMMAVLGWAVADEESREYHYKSTRREGSDGGMGRWNAEMVVVRMKRRSRRKYQHGGLEHFCNCGAWTILRAGRKLRWEGMG